MDFSSDTSASAHPSVFEAMARANEGQASSYGVDALSIAIERSLRELFGTDLAVWLVASGTAANALSVALLCPPTGAMLCHEEAHIERDERGAPEFFSAGGKLRLLPGEGAKIELDALRLAIEANRTGSVHDTPAAGLSLTNLTECGTAYTADELRERTALARAAGLGVHLDGARLANALAGLGAKPADLTWRAGVDVLTLGFTKTGAIGCEAIVLFGALRGRIDELRARAKRAGHMPAKMRFLAAQAAALLNDGLWLKLATQANARATQLAAVFERQRGARVRHAVDGNEVFVELDDDVAARLAAAGARFLPWPGACHRFVCSWRTTGEEIAAVEQTLNQR